MAHDLSSANTACYRRNRGQGKTGLRGRKGHVAKERHHAPRLTCLRDLLQTLPTTSGGLWRLRRTRQRTRGAPARVA